MKNRLSILFFVAILGSTSVAVAQTTITSKAYSIVDHGGTNFSTMDDPNAVAVGYARVQPGPWSTTPTVATFIDYRVNGILVSESSVPASKAMLSGRTFAEINESIDTGFAFANPNNVAVTVSYYMTTQSGTDFGQGSFTLDANAQMARFLDQAPFTTGPFSGSFTFSASAPIGVMALRGYTTQNGEFTFTTQPVASTSTADTSPFVMAQFAEGGGRKTEVLLINTTDVAATGNIQFYNEGGGSVAAEQIGLMVNGQPGVSFDYAIAAHGSTKLETSGLGDITKVGSVLVTPNGTSAPFAFTVLSFKNGSSGTITQTLVPSQPAATALRMYVETDGAPNGNALLDSGIAITNTSQLVAAVNFELWTLAGEDTGLTGSITVPAMGHMSRFLHEIFPELTDPFKGVLRITTLGPTPITITGLRTRQNERGDLLLTTTPVSDESITSNGELLIPDILERGGYETEFVLFSGTAGQPVSGTVQFFNQKGQAMTMTLQ